MNKKILVLLIILYLVLLFLLRDNKRAQIITTGIFAVVSAGLLTSIMTKKGR